MTVSCYCGREAAPVRCSAVGCNQDAVPIAGITTVTIGSTITVGAAPAAIGTVSAVRTTVITVIVVVIIAVFIPTKPLIRIHHVTHVEGIGAGNDGEATTTEGQHAASNDQLICLFTDFDTSCKCGKVLDDSFTGLVSSGKIT